MLSSYDYFINLLISALLVLGFYNIYFFIQRKIRGKSTGFYSQIDMLIPFRPQWVWVYSGLYYPVIFFLVFSVNSFRQFIYTVFSFIILLLFQVSFFYFLPVKTPDDWRNFNEYKSLSTRMLKFVQNHDGKENAFPSMHVSVATLVAFHLENNFQNEYGEYANLFFLFPFLILLSCLFTKQHYVIDTIAGFFLGWFCFFLFNLVE